VRRVEESSSAIHHFRARLDDLADELVKGLPDDSWQVARFIRGCFISDLRMASVASVTRRIRIPARTLAGRCRKLGLLRPHEILGVCKCIAVARAVRSGASITEASLEYGYAQPKTLRRAFKRFFGFTPSRLLQGSKPRRILLPRTLLRDGGLDSRS